MSPNAKAGLQSNQSTEHTACLVAAKGSGGSASLKGSSGGVEGRGPVVLRVYRVLRIFRVGSVSGDTGGCLRESRRVRFGLVLFLDVTLKTLIRRAFLDAVKRDTRPLEATNKASAHAPSHPRTHAPTHPRLPSLLVFPYRRARTHERPTRMCKLWGRRPSCDPRSPGLSTPGDGGLPSCVCRARHGIEPAIALKGSDARESAAPEREGAGWHDPDPDPTDD
jgi:hypothetical protein